MSETVSNDVSTESLCTVIENCTKPTQQQLQQQKLKALEYTNEKSDSQTDTCNDSGNDCKILLSSSTDDNEGTRTEEESNDNDTTPEKSMHLHDKESPKIRSKLKKSVSFDPNDEKIRKFVTGAPIVDQQNPFKPNGSIGSAARKKKVPPPVPTKRSTLSIKKTVTQQLREREREKEKERERLKNEANNRKNNAQSSANVLSSPDEFITTEEVLNQSKYVKTYIKNQDPFFVYDPTVLARIKFEELRELSKKQPPKKLKLTPNTRERIKELKSNQIPRKVPTFKKCSKPNYPELSDIKVKVGTELDGEYFNPAEVTKNAKKFDERVKKLHIGFDADLDEIDEPLTKSESSDEVTANQQLSNNKHTNIDEFIDTVDNARIPVMNGVPNGPREHVEHTKPPLMNGTFTNTINSQEFQEYLEKKGLTLIPKKIPNGAQPLYTNGVPRQNAHISFKAPERVQISIDNMDTTKTNNNSNNRKPSVFQRLLANSIFASRRRTTPKDLVPTPTSLYDTNAKAKDSNLKRVVLERQSFHGRSRVGNLLSENETGELRNHSERTRKSYASGDDLSVSISSALTNAEYAVGGDITATAAPNSLRKSSELQTKPIAKPPRRTLSRDRLGNNNASQFKQVEPQDVVIIKPRVQRTYMPNGSGTGIAYTLQKERPQRHSDVESDGPYLKRSLERQSLIPKRSAQAADRRQVFGRSASMDRNEILKRNATKGLQNRSRSATNTLKTTSANTLNSKENLLEQFSTQNGPKLTSTPIKEANTKYELNYGAPADGNGLFAPISKSSHLLKQPAEIYVDQQEWDRLRAIKERTDRELYYKVLQQQQRQQQHQQLQQQTQLKQEIDNIYEHLPTQQVLVPVATLHRMPPAQSQQEQAVLVNGNFVRGSPQRHTYAGATARNRQVKIIDGRAVLAGEAALNGHKSIDPTPRSQSVLDGMTQPARAPGLRRGYESDSETPVVMRRKQAVNADSTAEPQRRIGGLLTRDEIMQKVKEFCRKSLNKTPTNQHVYEKQHVSTDLSPVSYVSVETHHRPGSRLYAVPQVPQRMQSLPQQFVPITHEIIDEQSATTASPIYAHVIKRSSLQSNPSEVYECPPRPYLMRRESDNQTIYVSRGTLPRPELALPPTQYIIMDSEKISPAQVIGYHQQGEIYTQPQYIRPHQLQPMPGTYGYITVREPLPQQLRPRLHDGRSTPLILDRSSQQASQIYWTPQHQRLQQQQTGLLPIEISPRYTLKQSYQPVPANRLEPISRAGRSQPLQTVNNIPLNQQKFSTIARTNSPIIVQHQQQQQQQQQQTQLRPITRPVPTKLNADYNASHASVYEWESGSEAGEVQRIMERQKTNGEFRTSNILKNLRIKVSRLIKGSKR